MNIFSLPLVFAIYRYQQGHQTSLCSFYRGTKSFYSHFGDLKTMITLHFVPVYDRAICRVHFRAARQIIYVKTAFLSNTDGGFFISNEECFSMYSAGILF